MERRRRDVSERLPKTLVKVGSTVGLALALVGCDPADEVEIVNPCEIPIEVLLWGPEDLPSDDTLSTLNFVSIEGSREQSAVVGEWSGGAVFVRRLGGTDSAKHVDMSPGPSDVVELPVSICPESVRSRSTTTGDDQV